MNSNNNECSGEKAPVEISNTLEAKSSMTIPDANCENKISSLNIIALEYDDCNSDVEEIEIDSNKTENQNTVPVSEIQVSEVLVEEIEIDSNKTENQNTVPVFETQVAEVLFEYRVNGGNVSSSEESDSEDDSSESCISISSSTSSSRSDSSDSDSDSENTTCTNNNKKEKENKAGTLKQKKQIENEFNDLPPIEDLRISIPENKCDLLGEIENIVEQVVIVKPKTGKPTLHIDTVLFVEKGERALGKILDVFGPVSDPRYCVRFNSSEHIQNSNITVGMLVYYCPDTESGYTLLIFHHQLNMMKSHDVMGDDDEAPLFSDDEKEQAYLKQKNNKDSSDGETRKRQRTSSFTQNKPTQNKPVEWQSTHPWNRNGQFQRYNQKRQQAWRHNGPSNPLYGPCYNDPWMQYHYQSMFWPPVPRNTHPMLTGQNTGSGPSLNESHLSQYVNYNLNNSGVMPDSQSNNMQPPYPRIPFAPPPRCNPTFQSFPMNYPQFPNTSLMYSQLGCHNPVPPIHTNTFCAPLPPPPPPDSTTGSTTDPTTDK
ncbi:H/ACA ribonucleoprotein complex non-core subunit NAF1 [Nylanderia fulva]|uniref:H/ACA ribonucleoprotein complex non-core subunit NAF1 n=1 Tax=Nylanderia fulva TaxID=613905 RepID=UPI0010FB1321|nr:H/ACA ribonucleoprotein complex non-core subunit NAF1 [Nylanderia fulva]